MIFMIVVVSMLVATIVAVGLLTDWSEDDE
jgi:hypothetical protein